MECVAWPVTGFGVMRGLGGMRHLDILWCSRENAGDIVDFVDVDLFD